MPRRNESFITSPTCAFWMNSRSKHGFHIFNLHFLEEVSHESWVLTTAAFTFWRSIQTKCMVWWQVPEFWSFVLCLNIPCKNTSNTYLSFGAVQFCELECQGRDLERKRRDQKEMWWERNATRKVCQVIETQEKELSRERVVKRKSCQDQEMPGESGVKGQRCHEKGMSWERTVVRKGWTVTGEGDFTRRRSIWRPRKKCHATEMSREHFFNAQVVGRASYSHILAFALWLKHAETSASVLPRHTGKYNVAMDETWWNHKNTVM